MKKLLFLLFTGSLVGSCIPDEDVPIEPAITFKEYRFSQEDLGGVPTDFFYITFEYIDGDGDIGDVNATGTSQPTCGRKSKKSLTRFVTPTMTGATPRR